MEEGRVPLERLLNGFGSGKMLRYPGSDWHLLDELLAVLSRAPCRRCVLVEVFGGSGLVSQYASRVKFNNIVYNDKDNLLAELHRFVKENPQVLREIMSLIPFSRYVHDYISNYVDKHAGELRGLVAASFAFYLLNTSRNGEIRASLSVSKVAEKSEPKRLAGKINGILETARRFRDITIENLDFRECIKKYDTQETVFYLDPPYVSTDETSRNYYRLTFDESDTRVLATILNGIRGFYLLKIHEDQLQFYRGLNYKWRTVIEKTTHMNNLTKAGVSREKWNVVLLANYEPKVGIATAR